jgi:hypothetical protein
MRAKINAPLLAANGDSNGFQIGDNRRFLIMATAEQAQDAAFKLFDNSPAKR